MSISPEDVHKELSQYIVADGMPIIFDLKKSHDSFLVDAKTGRSYLDLFSFFATQPISYNHPKLNTPTFREKIGQLALHRPSLSDIYTQEHAVFVKTFAQIAGQDYFQHYFFVEGGALGVENALKVAFDWKVRKNLAQGRGEKGSKIIHFRDAFHGRTGYTLSLTNTYDPNKHQYFAKFDWPRVTNPVLRFPITSEVEQEVIEKEKKSVSEIQTAIKKHPHDIAALIIEPIQAEGGDYHFRPTFLQTLRKLADEYDFLLIFDEVQTGIGITGKMWAFEHFEVVPDLISFGKKVQVAGCASTKRVDEVKENVFRISSRINSTWGGNLVDMVRCTKYLKIIEEEKLVDHAARVGKIFLEKLQEWAKGCDRITNVRGRGLMIAFDLPDAQTRNAMKHKVFENGAVMLPCGPQSLRIRPHLDFPEENISKAMEILIKSEKQL